MNGRGNNRTSLDRFVGARCTFAFDTDNDTNTSQHTSTSQNTTKRNKPYTKWRVVQRSDNLCTIATSPSTQGTAHYTVVLVVDPVLVAQNSNSSYIARRRLPRTSTQPMEPTVYVSYTA